MVAIFVTFSSDVLEATQTFDTSKDAGLPTVACVPLSKLKKLFGPTHSTHSVTLDLGQSHLFPGRDCPRSSVTLDLGQSRPGKRCDYQLHLSRVAGAHTGKTLESF